MTSIFYHGRNDTDYTVTFSIAGQRWEYFLPSPAMVDACDFMAQRWVRKGLNYAKRRALRSERVQALTPVMLPPDTFSCIPGGVMHIRK